MIRPVPPHLVQGEVEANTPMGVCRRVWTLPLPWQVGHTSGVVPAAQPLPLQVGHCSLRSTESSFSQPKAASVKVTVTAARMLSPRWGALGLRRC